MILAIVKLPPPVTGVTVINQTIVTSSVLCRQFGIDYIDTKYARTVSEIGSHSPRKFISFLRYLHILSVKLMCDKIKLIYFQISPFGIPFLRDVCFVLIAKAFKKKILYHFHGLGIEKASDYFLFRLLYKIAFSNAYAIVLSEGVKKDIVNFDFRKIFILPNFCPELGSGLKRKNEKKLQILFFSNLNFTKGVLDFIKALTIVSAHNLKFNAVIAGAPGDLSIECIRDEVVRVGLNQCVTITGGLFGKQKSDLFHSSDIFVFPSHNDIWGLVLLEAMQASLPIIASKVGAIPEIIVDGENGLLVETQNSTQIASKIELLIHDQQLRDRLGENALKTFNTKYTEPIFSEGLSKIFREILLD